LSAIRVEFFPESPRRASAKPRPLLSAAKASLNALVSRQRRIEPVPEKSLRSGAETPKKRRGNFTQKLPSQLFAVILLV
jgi:hypothetical protein